MLLLGFLRALPIGYLFSTIFKNEKGVLFGFREAVAFIYIWFTRPKKNPRIYEYDMTEYSDDLVKMSVKVPEQEFQLEYRRNLSKDQKESESSLFYGENSSGSRLLVQITRRFDGLSSLWLNLKLDTGEEYSLPKTQCFVEPKTGTENFVCGGLRMKCLQPMRRWRISYNGLLKSMKHNPSKLMHVKFGFIFVASSPPYDVSTNIHPKSWARFLAQESNWNAVINEVKQRVDRYVQVGSLFGQVQVPDDNVEDKEVFLWGARRRHLDKTTVKKSYTTTEYVTYFKSGECLYFGQIGLTSSNTWLSYAFIMNSNSLGGAARIASISSTANNKHIISFTRGLFTRHSVINAPVENMRLHNGDASSTVTDVSFVKAVLDGEETGLGIILKNHGLTVDNLPGPRIQLPPLGQAKLAKLVIPLTDPDCRLSEISGGKGASLAELTNLTKEIKSGNKFAVPRGVVVTTGAYERYIKDSKLNEIISPLEKLAGENPSSLQVSCKLVVSGMQSRSLSEPIKNKIREQLQVTFGDSFGQMKFAVRSSASGEDSEELSAAGQMTTYLGVQGIDEIYVAVAKCWASQFSFVAVQYKRQNGQVLNSPMAVVIQEMIPADVAGVMFTYDPVTGNPTRLTITANYGIGESVVSAAAEPDTIIMERDDSGLTGVSKVLVGKKSLQIVLSDEGGVKEESVSDDLSGRSSLPADQSKLLADIGILVEESYGCSVDIEFGFHQGRLFLLQARPITTFDKESDFEIAHEFDSPMRSEEEYTTCANVGEVMPGATSFLGTTAIIKYFDLIMGFINYKRSKYNLPTSPYFTRGVMRCQNHTLMTVSDTVLRFYHGTNDMLSQAQMVSTFGRLIDDDKMLKIIAKRNQFYPPNSVLGQACFIVRDMLFANGQVEEAKKILWNFKIDLSHSSDVQQKHYDLWRQLIKMGQLSAVHLSCTMLSSIYNVFLLSILVSGNEGWGTNVFKDFAFILSSCYDVESVDIPNALEELSSCIAKCTQATSFRDMSSEEALNWLRTTGSRAGADFKRFLKTHGHRCLGEFDFYKNTWQENPSALMKTLQDMVCTVEKKPPKKPLSTNETIKKLTVKLSWKQKLLLRIAIPLCRKTVGLRERSKSLAMKAIDLGRKAFRELADILVKEGRIPEKELVYFLSHDELELLIKTRAPTLLQKALRRRAIFSSMDKVIFPEICSGVPRAINYDKKIVTEGSLLLKGTPASNGVAEGYARVATSLEEAANIQPGEILIAYSTDIGWSPFFPMLAGVATELGGLVSHGAVVAREYGLPCVVAVQSVTLHFQTGDRVRLNGNKGTLERLDV